MVGNANGEVYGKGLWPNLPDAWINGQMTRDSKIKFSMPQFFGTYSEEYAGDYPIYFTAFNASTGVLLRELTFDIDQNRAWVNPNAPISINLNKTGYLSIQEYRNATFTPVNQSAVNTIGSDDMQNAEYYDIQGRKINDITSATGVIIVEREDGTTSKIIKR